MAQIILDSNNNLIQGDFDNATLNNRTKLQTTTTNATTNVYVVPNGSSTSAGVSVANNSSLTNASKIVMATNGATDTQIISGVNGSGSYLPLSFYTNNTLAMQITTGGIISAAGGGIQFPATQIPSADANTLDDYEEGTWTPVFTASTPGTFSATYSIQVGAYNKIGNLVIASFSMAGTTTKGTASGDFFISGLPFNVANTGSDQFSGCIGFMNPVLPSSPIGLLTFNNSPSIYIGLAAGSTLQVSAVTNGTYGIRGTIIYRASA